MALTLGQLRQFAAEIASPDPSSLAADREISYWINAALRRIHAEHYWTHYSAVDRIYLDPEETGSNLVVTQDSVNITLTSGETFKTKYLTERWHLHVNGEGRMTFELKEIVGPTEANLKDGHNYTQASTTESYTWSRHIYPLPNEAIRVLRIELMQNRFDLRHLQPHEFDLQRQSTPTQRGNDPIFYTFRGGNVEVWPAPGTQRHTLMVTYQKGPPSYKNDDVDDTAIDWDMRWDDLLQKAVILEASITQGSNAPVQMGVAKMEYEECLNNKKEDDSGIQNLTGPMFLTRTRHINDYSRLTNYPSSIPEVG